MIDLYGLRNPNAVAYAVGVPHPGFVIVGTDGTIKAKLFYDGYMPRHGVAELLEILRKVER